MPYNIRFTDQDKPEITVFDNSSNTETSLTFPGRNVVGYGRIIAENFLHLLENFASIDPPESPIEGQLWYDSASGSLQISDGVTWKAASGILKGPVEPNPENSKEGELWVDTINQQLRIFNGSRWILVGPSQSFIQGLKYGPAVETIVDTDNKQRNIILFYVADIPVIIISKDSFTPKLSIPGFSGIKSGININTPSLFPGLIENFEGGITPKLNGISTSAESLVVPSEILPIPAARFLRSDKANTTDFGFNIKNNNGITLGIDQNFKLTTTSAGAVIYNSSQNSIVDIQINRNGVPDTILRVQDNKVGINNTAPTEELDVVGNIALSGVLSSSNTADATNLNTGSLKLQGGAAIKQSLIIGNRLEVQGNSSLNGVEPFIDSTSDLVGCDLGSDKRWRTIRARKIQATILEGTLSGDIAGNAQTATSLKEPITIRITGDVVANPKIFQDSLDVVNLQTSISSDIIINKPEPPGGVSRKSDYVLIHRPSQPGVTASGLLKQNRDDFVADLGIPIGAILPYAGSNPPRGFLFCDGSEVERAAYPDLYNVIGTIYNGAVPLLGALNSTFRLPDLRGRFALGRNNMDNSLQVPLTSGGFADAGGGDASDIDDPNQPRVVNANLLSAASGNSTKALGLQNIPEHSHSLTANGRQYSAIRIDTAIVSPGVPGPAPTASTQAQYLNDSGGVKKPSPDFNLGERFDVMNPYLTINYIIRTGPSQLETQFT